MVTVSMPPALLAEIDEARGLFSRSSFVAEMLRKALAREGEKIQVAAR